MATALLHLHSILRWAILILLLLNIFRLLSASSANKIGLSKLLLICAHTTLLIGLYQYFTGGTGFAYFQQYGSEVMSNPVYRFWAVEHITGTIAAIIFITIGHISLKKSGNAKRAAIFYIIALILILAVVPWPFREGIGRPWFPGMH